MSKATLFNRGPLSGLGTQPGSYPRHHVQDRTAQTNQFVHIRLLRILLIERALHFVSLAICDIVSLFLLRIMCTLNHL